jgi:hypothetical protein
VVAWEKKYDAQDIRDFERVERKERNDLLLQLLHHLLLQPSLKFHSHRHDQRKKKAKKKRKKKKR